MLIGIDASRSVTQQRTGTEAYAFFLIQALIGRTAGGSHRLRLYFNQPPPQDHFPQAPHVSQRVLPFARLWTHVRLAAELLQHPPDIFFTPAHVIPFAYRGVSVATVHDLGYHHFPEAHTRSQVAYLKLSTRANGRLGRRVIADSQATKADLLRFYHLDAQKIDVIYPGLDPALERVTAPGSITAAHERYGIRPPYLLAIGTLQPRKNLARLVQAFARTNLPHQLVLGGKPGWQPESLKEAIAALAPGVRDRVLLPGYIAESDKAALLSAADALVFPSLYEGFGFPALEAQSCGTPVLAANSSSLPEITGSSALLVDPLDVEALADGLQRITADHALREQLVQAGYANVQRFNWERTADAVLRTLEAAGSG
jgi:glycosyltransferase involved in cell wall biosynthesis